MKKKYKKPILLSNNSFPALPTALAVGLISAAAGAAAVGVAKLIGDDKTMRKNSFFKEIAL